MLSRSVRSNEDKGEVREVLNFNNIRDSWKCNLKLFKFLCKSVTSCLWDGKGIGRRHSHIILRCLSSDICLYFKVEFYLIFSLYHCCPSLLTIQNCSSHNVNEMKKNQTYFQSWNYQYFWENEKELLPLVIKDFSWLSQEISFDHKFLHNASCWPGSGLQMLLIQWTLAVLHFWHFQNSFSNFCDFDVRNAILSTSLNQRIMLTLFKFSAFIGLPSGVKLAHELKQRVILVNS